MRIIVAGAGEVGVHLAKMLGNEYHDIVVIDSDEELLRSLDNVVDVTTVNVLLHISAPWLRPELKRPICLLQLPILRRQILLQLCLVND